MGLGNPLLGDDGVGWRVAEQVARQLPTNSPTNQIQIECLGIGGLSLMEHLVGFDQAILIDAIESQQAPQGTVSVFPLEALPDQAAGHLSSAHDTTLPTAIRVGRAAGAVLPSQIIIVAIVAENVLDFSEDLSPSVAAAVPIAVKKVLELIQFPPRQ